MSKPDREACMRIVKGVGAVWSKTLAHNMTNDEAMTRLIHSAYELGRQDAARECEEICCRQQPPAGELCKKIRARFNLQPTDTGEKGR